MQIYANQIVFFDELSQFDFNENYFDFHNDYNCVHISLVNKILTFCFKKFSTGVKVYLKFNEVELVDLSYDFNENWDSLTIDSLYRGRCEKNQKLIELLDDKKGYFYVEFVEGLRFEFWSESLILESI